MTSEQTPVSQIAVSDRFEVGPEDDFLYYLRQGSDLLQSGNYDESRNALLRALELNSESTKAQNLLGLVYFKLGLLDDACAVYGRLLAVHPQEPALHVNLGLVHLRQGRLEEAEQELRAALSLAPDHERAHAYLAFALYRRGKLSEARDHFTLGGAVDLAQRVDARLTQARQMSPQAALREVAEAGLEGLDRTPNPFRTAEQDERYLHDEGAWQTQVLHSRPDSESIDLLEVETRIAPNTLLRAAEAQAAGAALSDGTPWALRVDESIPGFLSRDSQPTTSSVLDFPVSVTPEPVDTPLPVSLPPEETTARIQLLPPIPFVEPQLRLFGDLSWTPGFSTGHELGPQARLLLNGSAFVRRSTIVAAVGALTTERVSHRESGLGGSSDPILRLTGTGRLLLKVWQLAAALRDAHTLIVIEAALAGFEGGFQFDTIRSAELDLVRLQGRGSVLLDCPGPPIVVTLHEGEVIMVSPTAVLAWTEGVMPESPGSEGSADLVALRGHGLVIVASPENDHRTPILTSRL